MFPKPEVDYLSITYRADLNMLVARWQRSVTGSETRAGYQLILDAAQHDGCNYWLLDGRRRQPADAETTHWGFYEFFPSIGPQLGKRVFMSQLLSLFYQQLTEGMVVFQQHENQPLNQYRMRRFDDEAKAVAWLRSCQQEQG